MTSANFTIVTINPRLLSLAEAAHYLRISAKGFPVLCNVRPIKLADGISRYDRNALDIWVDAKTGCDPNGDDDVIGRLE